jgi:hypothetical protein
MTPSKSLAAAALALAATFAFAGGKVVDRPEPPLSERARTVETLRIATGLVRYGDATKDPLALITAARMLKQAGLQPSKAERAGKGVRKDKRDAMEVDAVLGRARTLAAGRQDLLALADDVAAGGSRGALEGPARGVYVVAPFDTDTVRISFRAGEPARVLVSGDGASRLNLSVADEQGNAVCRERNSDDLVCAWVPLRTGTYVVQVSNRGEENLYWIVHN